MMNRMQEWLTRAAEELGIRIVVGHVACLSNGKTVQAQVFFPDLGSVHGTLVFSSVDAPDAVHRRHLVEQGFAMSTFSEPLPNEEFDLRNYADMFAEWGWTGDIGLKPVWMD